ncbi:AEC family transporter [Bacillus cereus group sp. N11]|uniref:AEC family transporter n=1 Tax=Bacillus cereus group sp. N11 TaxID=2794585 RepID=UPI0018F68F03|nr:AEC family transporter [Bacillus cereus group sp. N11]MBJ8099783.1 AEC family transporter [Bacillus cereus group sp. N11]
METSQIFIILTPIFFTILLGYLAGYFKKFDATTSKGLNTLVTKFALPAHLFVGITTTPKQTLIEKWPFLLALVIGIVGFYIVFLLIAKYVFKFSLTKASMFSLNSAQPTFAFMGTPVLGSLFGASVAALPIAITGIVVNAILDPLATIIGAVGQRQNEETDEKEGLLKVTVKSILHGLSEPLACVPLIGVILVLCGFQSPHLLEKSLEQIGGITSGAALFAVGVTIGIRKVQFSPTAFGISLLKVIVQPLIMLGIAHAIGLSSDDVTKLVLLVAFPGSSVAAMISLKFDSLAGETASSFFISALMSLVTLPFLISWLM